MSRVLAVTGASAGNGLLKRALDLRNRVSRQSESGADAPATTAAQAQTPGSARSEIEKKKALESVLAEGSLDPEWAVTRLLHQLPELPESIQLPAHLFSLVTETLQVTKGAILLPDYDENLFVPWASVGIDTTTTHRLRIPDEDIEIIRARGPAGIIWEADEVRSFAPYFSRREAAGLHHILLFPLVSSETVQAVLLILETPYFDKKAEFLRLILAAVSEPAAQVVQKQRLRYLDVIRHAVVFKGSELPLVADRLAERAPRGVHLIHLSLADVISQVITENEQLDPYRVWQDLLRIVASLFASTGTVCDLDRNQLMICLHGAIEDDIELIVYHIGATIADLLPEVRDVPVLRFKTRDYPADGADLLQLARSLM